VKLRATLGLSLILLVGCRARQTGPDANYEQGSRIYQQLYAQELDDAYGDPRMEQAAALLAKVDPHSVDAQAAKSMLASIDTGRAALQKQRAEREKMAAAAAASFKKASSIDPQQILAASAPDAGSADPFGSGAAIADINATTGGCLIEGEPFREQGTGVSGTVYRLAKSSQCQDKLPGFAGQIVLVTDGRVYRRTADPTPPRPAEVPDAGAATVAAAASPAAARPEPAKPKPPPPVQASDQGDAGPEVRSYIPGGPMPGYNAQQQDPQQQDQRQ
jgi:hypothetical protein